MSQSQVPSNPSSEVSIEEIGAEEELAQCEKDANAHEVSRLKAINDMTYSVSKSSLYYLDPTFLSHMLMNLKTL